MNRGQVVLRVDVGGPPIEYFADQVTRVVAYNPSSLDAFEFVKDPDEYVWTFESDGRDIFVEEVLVYIDGTDLFTRHPVNTEFNARLTIDLRTQGVHKGTSPRVDRIKG
jgi:hypothetical protein